MINKYIQYFQRTHHASTADTRRIKPPERCSHYSAPPSVYTPDWFTLCWLGRIGCRRGYDVRILRGQTGSLVSRGAAQRLLTKNKRPSEAEGARGCRVSSRGWLPRGKKSPTQPRVWTLQPCLRGKVCPVFALSCWPVFPSTFFLLQSCLDSFREAGNTILPTSSQVLLLRHQ